MYAGGVKLLLASIFVDTLYMYSTLYKVMVEMASQCHYGFASDHVAGITV